jgi:two-component system nitrogen regulation response regulator GlnG/two-component system response regulator HydG
MSKSGDGMAVSTLSSTGDSAAGDEPSEMEMVGLAVIWSRDEPERLGEVLLVPPSDARPWIFGRGDAPGDPRRLTLARHRPGAWMPSNPLRCPRISRAQLRITAGSGGGVLVENIGRCALHHGGQEVERAEIQPGNVISLWNELLFLCIRRATVRQGRVTWQVTPTHPFGEADAFGLVGESPEAWELRRQISAVAPQPLHAIIFGPSGSGKELVARAIHARSPRRHKAMVARNAATIPEGLADAELFGNIRNYPNPGMPERRGLVGQAHESTLFLDEFAELPRALQAHLLRVMDDGEYHRLGDPTSRAADLRVLAATNRSEADLREDLLARFKLRIRVPGLDARREDVPSLAVHLLRKHAARDPELAARFFPDADPLGIPRLSPALVEALVLHPYTTHVRELDALLVRAAQESDGRYVQWGRRPTKAVAVPSRSEATPLDAALTAEERSRLAHLRQHGFSTTACGRDPAYPGNRQTADLHLRRLMCKSLRLSEWDAERAMDWLAGDSPRASRDKAAVRMRTFLSNLRERMTAEPDEMLRRALRDEWKGAAESVLVVVDALRDGRLPS